MSIRNSRICQWFSKHSRITAVSALPTVVHRKLSQVTIELSSSSSQTSQTHSVWLLRYRSSDAYLFAYVCIRWWWSISFDQHVRPVYSWTLTLHCPIFNCRGNAEIGPETSHDSTRENFGNSFLKLTRFQPTRFSYVSSRCFHFWFLFVIQRSIYRISRRLERCLYFYF